MKPLVLELLAMLFIAAVIAGVIAISLEKRPPLRVGDEVEVQRYRLDCRVMRGPKGDRLWCVPGEG